MSGSDGPLGPLVLGPILRYVDATSASVWVETRGASRVTVSRGTASASARTFAVHGHHYALEVAELHEGVVVPVHGEGAGARRGGAPAHCHAARTAGLDPHGRGRGVDVALDRAEHERAALAVGPAHGWRSTLTARRSSIAR